MRTFLPTQVCETKVLQSYQIQKFRPLSPDFYRWARIRHFKIRTKYFCLSICLQKKIFQFVAGKVLHKKHGSYFLQIKDTRCNL